MFYGGSNCVRQCYTTHPASAQAHTPATLNGTINCINCNSTSSTTTLQSSNRVNSQNKHIIYKLAQVRLDICYCLFALAAAAALRFHFIIFFLFLCLLLYSFTTASFNLATLCCKKCYAIEYNKIYNRISDIKCLPVIHLSLSLSPCVTLCLCARRGRCDSIHLCLYEHSSYSVLKTK